MLRVKLLIICRSHLSKKFLYKRELLKAVNVISQNYSGRFEITVFHQRFAMDVPIFFFYRDNIISQN